MPQKKLRNRPAIRHFRVRVFPMKLVAVSIVKNEADIIEAFVRHSHAWADYHLVFDHDSTDGTREILAELVREGLLLALFTDDVLANLQHTRSNALARLAFANHGADWVLPLDADEILCAPSRAALEQALAAGPAGQPATLPLRNYVPSPADDSREPNPVLRLRHRRPTESITVKIVIPRSLGVDPGVTAGKGNHALYRGTEPVASRKLANAWLAHFSPRSPHQQALRVLTAELQKLARGRAHEGLDVHYRLGFQLLAEDPERFFATVLEPAASLTLDPAPYQGGPLRHNLALTDLARTARAGALPRKTRVEPWLAHGSASHRDDGGRRFYCEHYPSTRCHQSATAAPGTRRGVQRFHTGKRLGRTGRPGRRGFPASVSLGAGSGDSLHASRRQCQNLPARSRSHDLRGSAGDNRAAQWRRCVPLRLPARESKRDARRGTPAPCGRKPAGLPPHRLDRNYHRPPEARPDFPQPARVGLLGVRNFAFSSRQRARRSATLASQPAVFGV